LSDILFTCAKGRWVEKYLLPTGTDQIVLVLLQSSGLQADATLSSYQTLGALLATATGNKEAAFTNYHRVYLSKTDITVTFNYTASTVSVYAPLTETWNAAGGAANNGLGALLSCYVPTNGAADTSIMPLTKHAMSQSTTGGNLTLNIPLVGTQN
jgi:hypothetical protein